MEIQVKRIYEKASKNDGTRILVDRIWPRGISKENARLDKWLKEIAPSTELRKWFGHKEARFAEFSEKYKNELMANKNTIVDLLALAKKKPLTLLYAAKDEKHNQAVVLKEFLDGHFSEL